MSRLRIVSARHVGGGTRAAPAPFLLSALPAASELPCRFGCELLPSPPAGAEIAAAACTISAMSKRSVSEDIW